jgi:hypothetical protein
VIPLYRFKCHVFNAKVNSLEPAVLVYYYLPSLYITWSVCYIPATATIKEQLIRSNFTPFFLESVHFSKSEWQ